MWLAKRIILTLILLPLLYLSCARLAGQFLLSTDKSSLFGTALTGTLPLSQAFAVGRDNAFLAPGRVAFGASRLALAASLDPWNTDYAYLSARRLMDENLTRAQSRAGQAIALSPIDPKNWLLLGWIHGMEGAPERAYAAFDKALMLDPRRPDSLAQQGLYLYQLEPAAGSEKGLYHTLTLLSLRTALELDNGLYENPRVNTALASLYAGAGQPGYAVTVLKRLPDDAPLSPGVALKRMSLLFDLGERVKAMAEWKSFLGAKPLPPEELERLESAAGAYGTPEFAYLLARIHMAQGKDGLALKELTGLVSRKGEVAEYVVALASVHERLGNQGEAAQLFERAVRLSPGNQEAKAKLMEYYAKAGRRP